MGTRWQSLHSSKGQNTRAARDEKLREVLVTNDKNWQEFLISLLELGVAEGAFRADLNPHAAATLIMSAFKGFAFGLALTPELAQETVAQLERWIIGESTSVSWRR